MHLEDIGPCRHEHTFATDRAVSGERRTRWVAAITVSMMS